MDKTEVSKFISLILRHKPEIIGITLDSHGWANVNGLIQGIKVRYPEFSQELLEDIVKDDEKQRYSFDSGHELIRANQGHSIQVDLDLLPTCPPEILYHGTGIKYADSIDKEGLVHGSRQYVHLSSDIDTATKVGRRHGQSVIYCVDSRKMYEDGIQFYKSVNGVWLVDIVPAKYLKRL